MTQQALDFLRKLVDTPSPPGHEQAAARVWRAYVEPYCDDLRTDIHGNTYAVVNPEAEMRVMLAGHLDEIGFIVHYIGETGLLYFKGVGGHDSVVPIGQRVWVQGTERVPGVIGRKPIHLLEDDEETTKAPPKIQDLWIDAGFRSKEEAESVVRLGSTVTYQHEFQLLAGDHAVARGFDNKVGAFAVAEALRRIHESGQLHPEVGVYAVATVQEEIGFRGATTASYNVHAKTGLAVDVSHATDYPGITKEKHGDLQIGNGPALTRGAFTSPVVNDMISGLAREEGIPLQYEVAAECTGTDATPMQVSRSGMAVGVIGIPLRYMHTPCEFLSLKDVELTSRLMAAYCLRVTPATDFIPR